MAFKETILRGVIAVVAAACAAPSSVQAHEMWLQPSASVVRPGETVDVAMLVGDAADVTPWKFAWDKLHSFKSYGPEGIIDQHAAILPVTDRTPSNASLRWETPGTYILVLETYHAAIELPADKFNAYIIEDGLAAAITQRQRTATTDRPGRELYSRRVKALIQVGDTVSDEVLQPIGETLEIVPERNPFARGTDPRMPIRVVFEGRPLPGALVALTALGTGAKPLETRITDAGGHAAFDIARRGNWLISVVWTRPMTDVRAADYDTIFASLSFGFNGKPN
ncbi:DUF4198 domain-containing protein [Sphingomonas bacterium]|uniref:DUF4198 domain-containing protein n=1 Tax=Sphingomonas bacterium TaxID=1895847 RepID=UPI0015770377|nr:DUF4198 domain-containing protein [Sphingomonas bacterium]